MDSNRSFPVMLTLKTFFCCIGNFSEHARFQIKHVLFRVVVAYLWLGNLNYHICYKFCKLLSCKLKCLRCSGLCERFLAYGCGIGFLVVHHMLPKCLFFCIQDTLSLPLPLLTML